LVATVVDIFKAAVSRHGARIEKLPPIVLVFGKELVGDPNNSAREMFLTWVALNKPAIARQIRTPEDFKDWNSFEGYSNLVDFEIDAGHLTKAIVLFLEGVGAFAELGSFCTDPILSERLFVVIANEFYAADSFIANGPIKKIEKDNEHSVCVLDTLDPEKILAQLPDLAAALDDKLRTQPKTLGFLHTRLRDQFLLVGDLVDLFGVLTRHEIYELVHVMGVEIDYKGLDRITSQLLRFGLIDLVAGGTKRFYVAPKARTAFLDYESPPAAPKFDRGRFKLLTVTPWLHSDKPRLKAYNEVHPKV
jgi:hypothetical protein